MPAWPEKTEDWRAATGRAARHRREDLLHENRLLELGVVPLSIAASISQIPELKEQCPELMLNDRT
jgi:hypothetical protein